MEKGYLKLKVEELKAVEEAVIAYDNFKRCEWDYNTKIAGGDDIDNHISRNTLEFFKEKLNLAVEECEKKLPKSLIDAFDIKGVE